MSGINDLKLDKLIQVNNLNYDLISDNIKKVNNNLDDLADCYTGKDIDFLFSTLVNQRSNLNKISDVIKSYSEVLSEVKKNYHAQDANFKAILDRSNTL